MKDFLYLDTDTISSISAQLFEGNVDELIFEDTKLKGQNITDQYSEAQSKSSSGKVGAKVMEASHSNSTTNLDGKQISFLDNETVKQSLKKVYDDFLFNKVQNELNDMELIKNVEDANQYEFVDIKGDFEFYDVSLITKTFEHDFIKRVMYFDVPNFKLPNIEEIESMRKEAHSLKNTKKNSSKHFANQDQAQDFIEKYQVIDIFRTIQSISSNMEGILEDKIIFLQNNNIIIGKREYLRIPSESLILSGTIKMNGTGKILTDSRTSPILADNMIVNGDWGDKFIKEGLSFIIILLCQTYFGLNKNDTYKVIHPIGLEFSKVSR